ncbi:hypothetical protein LJC03_05975, partial [Methanobrevibacter sp. OttesenSCG-928-I08]|nr:hypothetical protein [Methanobrevibacter sp. OttesenSCG-928-I08]
MNNKVLIGIVAAVVLIIAVGIIVMGSITPTTEVDTQFLKGNIQGEAHEENTTSIYIPGWIVEYNDDDNGIQYIMGMFDT